jgi:hypothetical protein
MHSIDESFAEARVPDGAPYTSVEARLSTVRIVYMQRFLNEFTEYLAGGAPLLAGFAEGLCRGLGGLCRGPLSGAFVGGLGGLLLGAVWALLGACVGWL